jgi:transcriptional repressor NrdR
MQCPFCHEVDCRVVDSRLATDGTSTWRRRECDSCKQRFTTYERVEYSLPTVVKNNGQRQPFMRDKVIKSMQVACNKRPVSTEQIEAQALQLERELANQGEREVASLVIGERVMQRLKEMDEVAYVRFASVYRSFRDIDEFMHEMSKLVGSRSPE